VLNAPAKTPCAAVVLRVSPSKAAALPAASAPFPPFANQVSPAASGSAPPPPGVLTVWAYNQLIRRLGKADRLSDAFEVLDGMARLGVENNHETLEFATNAAVKEVEFETRAVSMKTLPSGERRTRGGTGEGEVVLVFLVRQRGRFFFFFCAREGEGEPKEKGWLLFRAPTRGVGVSVRLVVHTFPERCLPSLS